jgi:glycosyltransferase involved in cell wall biosynthesis
MTDTGAPSVHSPTQTPSGPGGPPPTRPLPSLLSVVVPLYDEEATVPVLCDRMFAVLDALGCDAEVVAVDDGSSDRTRDRLIERAKREPRLRIVALSRNFGLQAAIAAGLAQAEGEAVVLMDGDLQDPPELVPRLLAEWRAGAHVVYATKRTRAERGLRRLSFELFHRLFRSMGKIALPLQAGTFSLVDRRVLEVINRLPEHNRYLPGIRSWVGFRQVEVPYDRDARATGAPRMGFSRLVELALDGLFGFSYVPVKAMTLIGILACALGLFLTVWVLVERFITHTAILGWPSLMIAVCFLGGAQLASVGILGEYVVRIYDEVRARPNFVVGEVIRFRADARPPAATPVSAARARE